MWSHMDSSEAGGQGVPEPQVPVEVLELGKGWQ